MPIVTGCFSELVTGCNRLELCPVTQDCQNFWKMMVLKKIIQISRVGREVLKVKQEVTVYWSASMKERMG